MLILIGSFFNIQIFIHFKWSKFEKPFDLIITIYSLIKIFIQNKRPKTIDYAK